MGGIRAGKVGALRADEAAGPGDETGVASGVGGDEFCGKAGALGEAGKDDPVERNAGGDGEIDDGLDAGQGGVEEWLVEFAGDEEGVGVPGVAVSLRREKGERGVGGRQGSREGEDVAGRAAAAMEEDDDAGGLLEGYSGAVELAVGVGVLQQSALRRALVENDVGKALLEVGAAGFKPGREAEALAEGFKGLVDGKAGIVGGELEEDAARFAEVDGVEVLAVKDFGGGKVRGDGGAPSYLRFVVGGAEGDVVDGTGAGAAEVGLRVDEDVDVVAEGVGVGGRGEAEAIAFGGDLMETHEGESLGGVGGIKLEHGDAEESADGVLGGNVRVAWGVGRRCGSVGYDFDLHAVGVGESEYVFFEAAWAAGEGHALLDEALFPKSEGGGGDAEGGVGDFAGTGGAATDPGPGKEREDGAWAAEVVAEVEVVGSGVVEVDGPLDEAEAEDLGVEVEIGL